MSQPTSSIRSYSVLFAATCINLILGSLYAWSVIGKQLVVQWHWSKTQAAMPFMISTASFAFTMIFAGRVQDKIGPKLVSLVGGLLFGAGVIVSYFAATPHMMALTYGLLGGIGIGLAYSATTPPSIKWFHPSRKGLITGIVVSGVGFAPVYVSPLTEYLLSANGISRTFIIIGIAALVLISLLSLALCNPPAGYAPAAGSSAGPSRKLSVSGREMDWREMLSTRQFYMLWVILFATAAAGLMIIANIATIAGEQAGWKGGYLAVALLAVFNMLGRIVSGFVSDRIGRTKTMMLAFSLQAINMFVFCYYTTWLTVAAGACLTGLCYATVFTLMPATLVDFYGIRNLGVNYGIVFTGFGIAGVAGPLLGAYIRDISGSYNTAYIISGVTLVAAVLLASRVSAPKPPADSQLPAERPAEVPAKQA